MSDAGYGHSIVAGVDDVREEHPLALAAVAQVKRYPMRTYRSALMAPLLGIWLAAGLAFPATTTADMQQTKLTASDDASADTFCL